MTHLLKRKLPSVLKWVCLNLTENNLGSSKTTLWAIGPCHIAQNPRFYGRKRILKYENGEIVDDISTTVSRANRKQAQVALLEYLHSTRNLQFTDAENMSLNSPRFLEKLLKKFETEENIRESISRYLRYHPINEFEPFFESLGLIPSQYSSLLPHNLIFLNDDKLLLDNYYVLCNYGIPRNRIGKIYMEAMEVFRYDYGILQSRLRSLEEMGLDQYSVIKVVASSPCLLTGNVNRDFFKILEMSKTFGIEDGWIWGHLLKADSYNWSRMLELLCLLRKMGCSNEQLRGLICQHPGLLFERSGSTTISLIGFLLKFGATVSQMISMFLQFPQYQVEKYVWNLRRCYQFLIELEMDLPEIGRIVRSQPVLLGSCSLKKVSTLLSRLNTGKKRLCEIIVKDPQELKNWFLGSRVIPLKVENSTLTEKNKFLLDLGFVKNSKELSKAVKFLHGKTWELQERFDCLVDAGLDRKDVLQMLKAVPQILNLSKDVIEMRIDFLVNGLGYPMSSLIAFPKYICYTIQRVNLRFSMYNWLIDQGTVDPKFGLRTILSCSDEIFIRKYVKHHPRGPEIWEKLKKEIYPTGTSGKTRIRWTQDLHDRFVECVNHLGGAEKATPKAILRLMDSEVLTIYHVKSHLQKYRIAKYMPDSAQGKSEKRTSMNDVEQINTKTGMQLREALQLQLDVQRRLHDQLEIQRNLQLRIEEQGKQLKLMFDQQQKTTKSALETQNLIQSNELDVEVLGVSD